MDTYKTESNPAKLNTATLVFTILIGLIGAFMMTLTSSPLVKGAALLWLPAALQLIAGVWLGPLRGLIAGGIGAYLAGIIAYGGWGLPDIIMNPIAGGIANSLLPGVLFRLFKIRPDFGSNAENIKKGLFRVLVLLAVTISIAFLFLYLEIKIWGYILPCVLLLALPLFIRNLNINLKDFFVAVGICVVISLISAAIGYGGMIVGGQTWEGAVPSAVGWFLGDAVSTFLGLYILASFTEKAKERGIFVPYL